MNNPLISTIVTIGSLFILGVIWFVRLESKVMYLKERVDEYKKSSDVNKDKTWEKIDHLQESMNKIIQSLARLEGSLGIKTKK